MEIRYVNSCYFLNVSKQVNWMWPFPNALSCGGERKDHGKMCKRVILGAQWLQKYSKRCINLKWFLLTSQDVGDKTHRETQEVRMFLGIDSCSLTPPILIAKNILYSCLTPNSWNYQSIESVSRHSVSLLSLGFDWSAVDQSKKTKGSVRELSPMLRLQG